MKETFFGNDILIKFTTFLSLLSLLILFSGCSIAHTNLEADFVEAEVDYATIEQPEKDSEEYEEVVVTDPIPEVEYEEEVGEYEVATVTKWPERVVFLTFDDGPGAYTMAFLDLLYEENVQAIFFLWGNRIVNSLPNSQIWLERMLADGHYIGLHSMTHVFDNLYSGEGAPARFVAEMLENQALLYDLLGHHTNLCRAPFGMITGFSPGHFVAIEEAGINCIDWNVDPRDWYYQDPWLIYQSVISQVEFLNFPPEINLLLHEYAWTVEALPMIIAFLREHGYVFKTYTPGLEFRYREFRQ